MDVFVVDAPPQARSASPSCSPPSRTHGSPRVPGPCTDHVPTPANRKLLRRALAIAAIVTGALLMWLSPEQLFGALTLVAGIALEALGIHLDHV